MNGNLGIGDLTNGVSAHGARDYVEGLNMRAIDGAIRALQSTGSVKNALEAGWQGAAEANFERNLDNAVRSVEEVLQEIKQGVESLVSELVEDLAIQDRDLVEVEDIVNFQ